MRVLRSLVAAAEQFGRADPSGSVVVPLTQEDLAAIAGTSRATTNRTLRAAADAGALRLGRSRIEILEPGALVKLAG
jgi:CRP-like cAMP-binding protein